MSHDNGEPAFPLNELNQRTGDICAQHFGLTVRDYFAAKAMQGFMANKANPMRFDPEQDAEWAFKIADAMLTARTK